MDSTLQAQFQRLELALSTLVDSIASYNPSPQAAVDLVAADDELSRGLDQLATHQANHARILALRAEADALEAQFKSSVSVLAGLRRELFETPATTFPDSSRLVPFEELLQYAKNISEYTIPPSYRERIPEFDSKVAKDKEGEEEKEKDSNLSIAPVVEILKDTADGEPELEPPKEISAEEAGWLKDLQDRQYSWYPWPVNDKIRKGSLMQIQRLRDMGTD
ncbi:mediator complex, subunit Med4, partial [Massariosphaeria phaeospora]